MLDRDSFRSSRRPGGKKHVTEVRRKNPPLERPLVDRRGTVEQDQWRERKSPGELAPGHDADGARILHHAREALRRHRRLERKVRAARLPDGVQSDDQFDRGFETHPDQRLLAHAPLPEPESERRRARVELPIGEVDVVAPESHLVGVTTYRVRHQAMNARRPIVRLLGRVESLHDRHALGRIEHRHPPDRISRVRAERAEQVDEPGGHLLDVLALEKRRVVLEHAFMARRGPLELQREIVLRGAQIERDGLARHPAEPDVQLGDLTPREEDLDERCAARISLGPELFDQHVERDVLVGVGVQRLLPDARHHIEERRIARETDAQRQHVDEAADHTLELGPVTVQDGRTDNQVFIARVLRDKYRERGE